MADNRTIIIGEIRAFGEDLANDLPAGVTISTVNATTTGLPVTAGTPVVAGAGTRWYCLFDATGGGVVRAAYTFDFEVHLSNGEILERRVGVLVRPIDEAGRYTQRLVADSHAVVGFDLYPMLADGDTVSAVAAVAGAGLTVEATGTTATTAWGRIEATASAGAIPVDLTIDTSQGEKIKRRLTVRVVSAELEPA